MQLSDTIIPTSYNLFFEPDLKNFTFKGKVQISLKIIKPASKIILNSSELKINNAEITHKNKTLKIKIKLDEKDETLTLQFNKTLASSAILALEFQGKLNDNLIGFYRSSYQDENGKQKYLATTQFEAPYARKAFPCFDEPSKKAKFNLSLKIPRNLKAISNMPIISEKIQDDKKILKFQETPRMSTYLLYMGVGDFEFIESNLNNINIRIVTTKGKAEQGKFALDLAKKFLKYFQDYSKIPYPLPKLDLIAIPDFSAGAMENWGAITFREVLLLFDHEKTSTRVKKRIAEVIAHELWHQWSGNLVTMKWWNDLWLNESFATFMAFKAVSHYFPEWQMWEDFVTSETSSALNADSLKTTHPIEVNVKIPNEIEEIFDAISYGKGGSILRMIESYLSPAIFQKGIQEYLSKYKYKNAIAQDLWNSLSKTSNNSIKQIMESWIKQKGYPLVEAKQNRNKLILTQKKFNSSKQDKTIWKIPVIIKTDDKTIKTLLTKKTKEIQLKNTKWFKLNEQQKGFYRVKYSEEDLQKLKELIKNKKLSALDRNQIQNDLFSLSLINEISLDKYLEFIKSYDSESSCIVLEDLYLNLYSIYAIFSQEKSWQNIWPKFKEHIKSPFQKNFQRLSWSQNKKENHNDCLLRPLTINYLSFAEDEEILKTGIKKFQTLINNPNSLHPDVKGSVYLLAARNGDKNVYNSLLHLYTKTQSPEEQVKLLSALYKFKHPEILKNSLNLSLSDKVRIQNLRTVFSIIPSNPYMKSIFLPWTKKNWPKLEQYKKINFAFMALLSSLITSYTGKEKEEEIRQFLNSKKIGYEKTKANAFEIMQINTRFLESNRSVLENYFK